MKKESYEHLCLIAEAGQDAFIHNLKSDEHGMVTDCIQQTGHLVVRTPQGDMRCWSFQECEELHHGKSGPVI